MGGLAAAAAAGGEGEKGRGRSRLTEDDVSETDAQAGSRASAPRPPTRVCRCGQPGAPPPRCRGPGPGWGRCAAGGVPTWVWRAWALGPQPGPSGWPRPRRSRALGFRLLPRRERGPREPSGDPVRSRTLLSFRGRPGEGGPTARCRRGAVEGPRPPLRSTCGRAASGSRGGGGLCVRLCLNSRGEPQRAAGTAASTVRPCRSAPPAAAWEPSGKNPGTGGSGRTWCSGVLEPCAVFRTPGFPWGSSWGVMASR